MAQKMSKTNQSVEKTMRIVEILARANSPMRLSDIARDAEMPASTTLRMVNTLVECGYAYQEENGSQGYGLTMRFFKIGQQVASHFSIRDLAHPYLVSLAQEAGESCCLAILDHDEVRYLDVVESAKNHVMIRQRVGGSAPLHCTGSGKLFLCQYPPEKLAAFASKGLRRLTPHTLTSAEELEYELRVTRERGYAVDNEECEIGMSCLAEPIYDINHKIIAVISLSGPDLPHDQHAHRSGADAQPAPGHQADYGKDQRLFDGIIASYFTIFFLRAIGKSDCCFFSALYSKKH